MGRRNAPFGNQANRYLLKPRRAPARSERALFLAGLAVERVVGDDRVTRFAGARSYFSAENARSTDGLLGSTALAPGRDRLVTFLPSAAIFFGVCNSVALRLGGISMAPVCLLKADFLPTR